MKRQLPLLILLSASTFGLGHELGANGPRDNPDTPWGPGDSLVPADGLTKMGFWAQNFEVLPLSDEWFEATKGMEATAIYDLLVIEEEVGDWALIPGYGHRDAGLFPGMSLWWYMPDVLAGSAAESMEEHVAPVRCMYVGKGE